MKNFFPIIKVSGSNYDIGYAIGNGTKKQVHKVIKLVSFEYKKHTDKDFSHFVYQSKKFLKINQKQFPQYLDEIRGIACGADVSFEEIFALNCLEELSWDNFTDSLLEKCTSFVAKTKQGLLLCHNEDYSDYFRNLLYIIKVQQKNSSFVSLAYAGALPGSSVGINSDGIAFSGNSLNANDVQDGALKNFLYRSILDANSITEAVEFVIKSKRAIGGNYLIVSKEKAVNIETSATKYHIDEIKNFPFHHTNHYLSSRMKKFEQYKSQSSVKRLERLHEEDVKPETLEDVKKILSDHKNKLFPICRHSETLASAIINVSRNELFVCKGNPCKNNYVEIN